MALEQNIMTELKAAMLAKDEAKLRGLRAIKSAILLAKTSGGAEMSEADEIKMLQKLVKQRMESLEIYEKQGRADLAAGEKQEIEVISKFLPQMMGEDQVRAEIKNIIASVGATSAAEMGKVMGAANKVVAGRADGKLVSQIVKELLG